MVWSRAENAWHPVSQTDPTMGAEEEEEASTRLDRGIRQGDEKEIIVGRRLER